eukprot:12855998-Prorocentrum_lima.AAC.1
MRTPTACRAETLGPHRTRPLEEPLSLGASAQGMSPEVQAMPPFRCHCAALPLFSQAMLRLAEVEP